MGDEQKRRIYDGTGMNADEQNQADENPFSGAGGFWNSKPGQRQGPSMEEEIFGDFEEFFNLGGMHKERSAKGRDLFITLDLTFMESINGCKREIKIEKKGQCQTCNGSKCKPGTAPSKCYTCGGRGVINHKQGPMTLQMTCTKCRGGGVTIKHPCQICRGIGVTTQQVKEEILIPKGISDGQSMKLTGKV